METALDWVCDYIGSGETLRSLAADLSVTSATVRRALAGRFGEDEVKRRLAAARVEGGHSLADKAIERAQNIEDKDDAAGARVEVGAYQWTAQHWNREQYGAQAKTAVQVNMDLGAAHLEALRRAAARDRAALPVLPAEVLSIREPSAPDAPPEPRARSLEAGNRADTRGEDAA